MNHQKKVERHIGWNDVIITITMKAIVWILSSLSSNQAASTDFPDFLSPFVPSAGFPNYILCLQRANVDKFLLVGQHWHDYEFVLSSPAVCCISCTSYLDVFLRWEVSGRTAVVSWGVASRICSLQLGAFLCSFHQAFSPYVLSASMWCIHTEVLIPLLHGRNPVFFYQIDQIDSLSITVHTFARRIPTSLLLRHCCRGTWTCVY